MRAKVLVVDDDEVTRKLLSEVLQDENYEVSLAESGEQALRLIKKTTYDLVLSDIRMLDVGGLDVLKRVKKESPQTAVILMTGFGTMEVAIEAIQEGAFDYLSKPFKIDDLKQITARALKQAQALKTAQKQKKALLTEPIEMTTRTLIGRSPSMVEVFKTLARASLSSSPVLINGELGTGKELVAYAIHENGSRKTKKLVSFDCRSSDSESIKEAELLKAIEQAKQGTLFLDEVAELSPNMQLRLLKILDEDSKSDVRMIAATTKFLDERVRNHQFREDLYYRLRAIVLELLPLRERLEDLPDLVDYFVVKYASKNKKRISHVSDDALKLLTSYEWPGNIRELEHHIERAVALAHSEVLLSEDFPHLTKASKAAAISIPTSTKNQTSSESLNSLDKLEKEHIIRVLKDVHYNKSKASEILGIDRATLYRKAQRYGIDLHGKS